MKIYLLLTSLLCLVSACTPITPKKQPLEAFIEGQGLTQIDQVILQDGSTGEAKTMQDPEQIEEIIALILYTHPSLSASILARNAGGLNLLPSFSVA